VRGHRLGVFERAAALEVGGDAGRPEDVAAEPVPELVFPETRPSAEKSREKSRRADFNTDGPVALSNEMSAAARPTVRS
jgi:hypothetical protein